MSVIVSIIFIRQAWIIKRVKMFKSHWSVSPNEPLWEGFCVDKQRGKPTSQSEGDSVCKFTSGHSPQQLAPWELLCNYQQQQQGKCKRGQILCHPTGEQHNQFQCLKFVMKCAHVNISTDQNAGATALQGDRRRDVLENHNSDIRESRTMGATLVNGLTHYLDHIKQAKHLKTLLCNCLTITHWISRQCSANFGGFVAGLSYLVGLRSRVTAAESHLLWRKNWLL